MNAIEHRHAMIGGIKAAMTTLVDVAPHGGRFDLAEVKAIAQKSPAARLSCLSIGNIEVGSSGLEAMLTWNCMIITTDRPNALRDDNAFALVSALLKPISDQCWGASTRAAENIRATNLYSRKLTEIGVAMWAVSWKQLAELDSIDPADLDDLLRVNVEYDLAPIDGNIDARDQIDLDGGSATDETETTVDHEGDAVVDHEGKSTGS